MLVSADSVGRRFELSIHVQIERKNDEPGVLGEGTCHDDGSRHKRMRRHGVMELNYARPLGAG